ncbi:MAG TPA: tetratricopeptide repeat protein [Gammaproteobacteria bacterium]|nr:tetratricopeptide repeat protein [Gammaproteobacteria bacterium]
MREYSTREVADIAGLPERRILRWAGLGLVTPAKDARGQWRFSFQDLALLRTASKLLAEGLTPTRVTRALKLIREQLPEGRPLSAVRIVIDGNRVLVKDRLASWEPESRQGTLDFDVKSLAEGGIAGVQSGADARECAPGAAEPGTGAEARTPRGVSALAGAAHAEPSAETLYAAGLDLELAGRERDARKAYEAAIARDARHVSARINLGRLLHAGHSFAEAERLYRTALEHEPRNALAAFNLGVALEDQGKADGAIEAYRRALEIDESYADAHFNLSRLLESRGDKRGALRHLSRFRRLMQRDS